MLLARRQAASRWGALLEVVAWGFSGRRLGFVSGRWGGRREGVFLAWVVPREGREL